MPVPVAVAMTKILGTFHKHVHVYKNSLMVKKYTEKYQTCGKFCHFTTCISNSSISMYCRQNLVSISPGQSLQNTVNTWKTYSCTFLYWETSIGNIKYNACICLNIRNIWFFGDISDLWSHSGRTLNFLDPRPQIWRPPP